MWIFFPNCSDKQYWRGPEMKSHGNQKLIKMKLCNNTIIIHHHSSCICLQETDYMDPNWNIILPSFELFMALLTPFVPQRKTRTHRVTQGCVCICERLNWSFKASHQKMVLRSHTKSLIQFTGIPPARVELSTGLPSLMRLGVKWRVVGWLSSARWWF